MDEQAFHRLLDGVSQGALLCGPDRGVIYANRAFCEMTGYARGELLGRNCALLQGPGTDPATVQEMRCALDAGEHVEVEILNYRKSGEAFWNALDITPYFNASGALEYFMGISRDVTDRKNSEVQLVDSIQQYRFIFDNMKAGVVLHGADSEVLFANSTAQSLLGLSEAEMLGETQASSLWSFLHEDGSPMSAETFPVNIALKTGEPTSDILLGIRQRMDRPTNWVLANAIPTRGADGCVNRVVVCFVDVSKLRETEFHLIEARRTAEAATLAKSEFLANMSHEIRTPLTAVLGFTGLLEAFPALPAEARTYANRIATSGQTLLSVVNDILDFSKLEAQRVDLEPHPFDPLALAAETLALVSAEADEKGLKLSVEAGSETPEAVLADGARVRQVLLNLLSNAIKFTYAGGVSVKVDYRSDARNELRISVADTGIGIQAEKLDRLFERFSQIDGSNSRLHGGTGLGLAISKSLTELMGGEIGVESCKGGGSAFWFAIPAPRAEPAIQDRGDVTLPVPAGEARILIVDDVAVNRELVRTLLSPFAYDLSEAATGAEAVKSALARPYDLILMDLQMPGMDGLAATRAIREACDHNRQTPILALSANVLPHHLAECAAAGMDDHIAKPISPMELLTKIAQWTEPADAARLIRAPAR